MMITQSMHTIEAEALDDHSWRICDASKPREDASSLLAFVQRWGDRVQVVWLTRTDLPIHFDSLGDAIEAARTLCERNAPMEPLLASA